MGLSGAQSRLSGFMSDRHHLTGERSSGFMYFSHFLDTVLEACSINSFGKLCKVALRGC